MGDVMKTVTRVAAGVFTLGLSEVAGGLMSKSTAAPAPVAGGVDKVDETKVEADEAAAEKRRRQLIARQNMNIKTSPLGAQVAQTLGGPTLTGM